MGQPWPHPSGAANLYVGEQDTSHVAAEVLAEQEGNDIFNPPVPAEVKKLRDELDTCRREVSELWAKLYGKPSDPLRIPPYEEKERLMKEIDAKEEVEAQLTQYLNRIYEAVDGSDERRSIIGPLY